jgi:nitrate reductase (cytochrome), electron transfer subunit
MTWHRSDWLALGCAAILGASGVGFLIGLHGNARVREVVPYAPVHAEVPEGGVPHAVPYAELATASLSVNGGWKNDLGSLVQHDHPTRTDPVPEQTVEAKAASLLQRSERRAYAGAPPVIPHTLAAQRSAADCLACHREGLEVQGRIASKISHPPLTNCTQCHVESTQRLLGERDMPVNTFIGSSEPLVGQRAYQHAPPTMPHRSSMREDCSSCHGPLGRPGLRTTHPERTNCVQCHASSAVLDQRQMLPPGPQ